MVAIDAANNASNDASNEIENGTPSSNDDDIMREIVLSTTAEVSATFSSDCNARNAKGESALSISSSNFFLGGMKLLNSHTGYPVSHVRGSGNISRDHRRFWTST